MFLFFPSGAWFIVTVVIFVARTFVSALININQSISQSNLCCKHHEVPVMSILEMNENVFSIRLPPVPNNTCSFCHLRVFSLLVCFIRSLLISYICLVKIFYNLIQHVWKYLGNSNKIYCLRLFINNGFVVQGHRICCIYDTTAAK